MKQWIIFEGIFMTHSFQAFLNEKGMVMKAFWGFLENILQEAQEKF